MRNLKDERTKIFPSITRGGKELPSSSALDSPSVMSKFATTPHAINPDMSQVIDDATSAMNDAIDDASTFLDKTVLVGEFLDEQVARARENEIIEDAIIDDSDDESYPNDYEFLLFLRVMLWKRKLLELSLLVKIDMILKSY